MSQRGTEHRVNRPSLSYCLIPGGLVEVSVNAEALHKSKAKTD
jgi:hypothetical protein